MSFKDWFFGFADNPVTNGRWGPLHIATMIISIGLIIAFYFIVKRASNKEKTKKIIVYTLVALIAIFEILSRFVYFMKLFYFKSPDMNGTGLLWIIIPKPWCAISCWALIASVFVKKRFFYDYAALSALLCSVIFFSYPGVGFNNQYILFDNFYSICTHALLLITSITLITLKFTGFKYRDIWKCAIAFAATFLYGLLEIFVLKTQSDPMYFMPNGDIQAGILHVSYGLYLTLYIALLLIYTNAFYLVSDRENVKAFFRKILSGLKKAE